MNQTEYIVLTIAIQRDTIKEINSKGVLYMTKTTTIRIKEDVKQNAKELFESLGLDLSSAINIFLRQSLLKGGLPFEVTNSNYERNRLDAVIAMEKEVADGTIATYDNAEDAIKALHNA